MAASCAIDSKGVPPEWCNRRKIVGIMAASVRQSVTVPADLARRIARDARQRHQTFSKTLLDYARLGLLEEERAKKRLRDVAEKIQAAPTPEAAGHYAGELTEAIFGPPRKKA